MCSAVETVPDPWIVPGGLARDSTDVPPMALGGGGERVRGQPSPPRMHPAHPRGQLPATRAPRAPRPQCIAARDSLGPAPWGPGCHRHLAHRHSPGRGQGARSAARAPRRAPWPRAGVTSPVSVPRWGRPPLRGRGGIRPRRAQRPVLSGRGNLGPGLVCK